MTRAELESTAPIKRDELLGLLNAMAEADEPVTPERQVQLAARARAMRKAAKRAARKAAKRAAKGGPARLFNAADLDDLLTVAVSTMITPHTPEPVAPPAPKSTTERPKRKTPFSHVAAMLAPCEPARFPRATRPPPLLGPTHRAEQRAAQAVAEVRARLDTAEEIAADRIASRERASFSALSPHVVEHLSAEEITMLPMEIRLTLPELPHSTSPPIDTPADQVIDIHSVPCSELGHAIHVTARPAAALHSATIIAIFAALFVVGFFLAYLLS